MTDFRVIAALMLLGIVSPVAGQTSIEDVVRSASPSVVTLLAYDPSGELLGQASGAVLEDGRVATNAHAVAGAGWVEVYDADGALLATASHATNLSTRNDLALLPSLPAPPPGIPLGRALPDVGERVVVIGSPRGFENTVSDGLVSATRTVDGVRLIQITAPISEGSSGGPVLNLDGELVGVAVGMIEGAQNLNFAVPSATLGVMAASAPGTLPFPASDSPPDRTQQRSPALSESTERRLQVGSEATGRIDAETPRLDDGTPFDGWTIDLLEGQQVLVDVVSNDFDPLVIVLYDTLNSWEDDDGGEGTNSRLEFRAPATGSYLLVVQPYDAAGTGSYGVAIREGAPANRNQRWIEISPLEEGTVYLDTERVDRNYGGTLELWLRMEWDSSRTVDGDQYDTTVMNVQFDCERTRMRMGTTFYYDAGELTDSHEGNVWSADWISTPPGSYGENMIREACRWVGND